MGKFSRLEKVYYDLNHPAGFSGVNKLYNIFKKKLNKQDIRNWLHSQKVYTLHKSARQKYSRRRIYTKWPYYLLELDLIQLNTLAKYNNNYNYILIVIDTFSKYIWTAPLKGKTGKEVSIHLEKIFTKIKPAKIKYARSDRGREFLSNQTQNIFKKFKIKYYPASWHCAIVERVNRTIKEKIFKYLTYKNTKRYIDILPHIVNTYNNTVHRSIKLKPVDALLKKNELFVRNNLFPKNKEKKIKKKIKLKVGDLVRISHVKQAFDKSYLPRWSTELFKIHLISKKNNPPMYIIKDLLDEVVEGKFYNEELQIYKGLLKNEEFEIEKILKTRTLANGVKEYYVKWKSYPPKFNEWVKNVTKI